MEFITLTVIVLVVVWYFGKPIKASADLVEDALTTSANMARKRLALTSDQQEFRVQEDYNKLGSKVIDADLTHSRASVKSMLEALDTLEDEKDK